MQTVADCYLVARMTSQLFPSCGHTRAQNKHAAKQFLPFSRCSHPISSSKDAHRKDPNPSLFVFFLSLPLSLFFTLSLSLFPCLWPFITTVFILSFCLYLCQDWFPFSLSQAALCCALQYSQYSLLICTHTHTHTFENHSNGIRRVCWNIEESQCK